MTVERRVLPAAPLEELEPLRYQRPELPPIDEVVRYYALAEEARHYSNGGPCHERLAARLATYLGAAACLPVANCTLGLMAALRVTCGEPDPRRRLIATPAFTFTATACAIRWAGFEPLFVDVDAHSWQLDADSLAAALDERAGEVCGVLACSTFGSAPPAPLRARWRSLCAARGLPLVIDSAAAFGARDENGRRAGAHGDVEVFSFHATKPFAIGEGGAIACPDREIAKRLGRAINFGLDPESRTSASAGLNAKMSELHAACGLAMLDRFDDALARRRESGARLMRALVDRPLTYQAGSEGSTWQVFQLLVPDAATRTRAVAAARPAAVELRTCFDPPLHRHPAFADAPRAGTLEVTERVARRSLSLPLANSLGERQVARLAGLVDAALGGS